MNPLSNTLEILNPIIPLTDLLDKGLLRERPGARNTAETLANGSRHLDESFWIWQYAKQNIMPIMAWEN